MTKLLDLRDKGINKVKVVERIIFKPRSFKVEMIKMLSIVAIVISVGFGISSANDFVENKTLQQIVSKNFSAVGVVSDIYENSISINEASGSNDPLQTAYIFDTSEVIKIENTEYAPLRMDEINVGDRIVVQGVDQEGIISIRRIISLASTSLTEMIPNAATSTATTTVETSTTTDISGTIITETPTTTDATSTPTIIETITDTVGDIVDKAKETIQNVVDTVTGTTTEENKSDPEVVTPPTTETTPTPEVTPVVEPAPTSEPQVPSETPAGVSDPAPIQ